MSETESKCKQRHKLELKKFQQATKDRLKRANKGGRDARRDEEAKIKAEEEEMLARHAKELAAFAASNDEDGDGANGDGDGGDADDTCAVAAAADADTATGGGLSKAAKRRAAKEAADAEREQRVAAAKAAAPKLGDAEMRALRERLTPLKKTIHEVPADGDCLYSALIDQCARKAVERAPRDVPAARRFVADEMTRNRGEYAAFIDDDAADAAGDVDSYVARSVLPVGAWGGEIEVRALAHALRRPIRVYRATLPAPLLVNAEAAGNGEAAAAADEQRVLELSFHEHAYTLGTHYNSVVTEDE